MDLRRTEVQFVGVVITGRDDARQDILQLRVIVEQAQQGFAARAMVADAENVLGSRVQAQDKQIVVEQDYARTQAIKDSSGRFASGPAVIDGVAA